MSECVLVIDDDAAVRSVLSRVLRAEGIDVVEELDEAVSYIVDRLVCPQVDHGPFEIGLDQALAHRKSAQPRIALGPDVVTRGNEDGRQR